VDAHDPDEIMRRLDERVVYQSRIDITEYVIALVSEKAGGREDRGLVEPRPVKRFPPGTKVAYASCRPRQVGSQKSYKLSRQAADRVVSIVNRIEPHPQPVRLRPYTCAPVGSFTVGDTSYNFLKGGIVSDPACQGARDPVLKKLVEILEENDWKMDDRVIEAWIRELERTTGAKNEDE
jgi:hypothetical protein